MTPEKFRELALEHLGAVEGAHMGHPDFRVGGKIFASLGPKEAWGMVKLTPQQQAVAMRAEPEVFSPAAGAWGRGGATIVTLRSARVARVRKELANAWRNVAPKDLLGGLGGEIGGASQGSARTSSPARAGKSKGSSNSSPRKREPR